MSKTKQKVYRVLSIRILGLISVLLFGFKASAANQPYWQLPQENTNASDNLYFTWLGCDSCLMIEERLDLSEFKAMPLIARPDWRAAAKIQVAMDLLEMDLETINSFKQLILDKKVDAKNLSAMTNALIELGVDQEQLDQKLSSAELFAAVQYAVDKAKQYEVKYVPTVVVKGQYATDAQSTGSISSFNETITLLKNK